MQQTIQKLGDSFEEVGLEYRTVPMFKDITLGANLYVSYPKQAGDSEIIKITIDADLFMVTIPGFCVDMADEYGALKACNIAHTIPYEPGKFIYKPSKQTIDYVLYNFMSEDIQSNLEAIAADMKIATSMDDTYALIKEEYEKEGRTGE